MFSIYQLLFTMVLIYGSFIEKIQIEELPKIYMDDAVRATIELMDAPASAISIRTSYNIEGMSFTPQQLGSLIQQKFPNFEITCKPDFRQEIADSWPNSIDDSKARNDWNWKPKYNLESMTDDMIKNLLVTK